MRNFGARLRRFRKIRGFTQRTLSAAINRHERTVAAWEESRTEPYATDLARLVNVLRVSMGQLFGIEPFDFPDETLKRLLETDHGRH